MKLSIPGDEVRRIRTAFGLTVPQLAAVLAVHPGTVHRWEMSGAAAVPVDGVAANVLAGLRQRVPGTGPAELTQTGEAIKDALLVGGALLALAALLKFLLEQR